jgi:Carbohydrate esterase 2 N-terminal/GDSL-like Lipase/Acylhydrolase family
MVVGVLGPVVWLFALSFGRCFSPGPAPSTVPSARAPDAAANGVAPETGPPASAVPSTGAADAAANGVAPETGPPASAAGPTPSASSAVGLGAIRWIGRVDASRPDAVRFAWSGSGLAAIVAGTKVSVRLQTEGATESAFFQSVVDGAPGARLEVKAGPPLTVVLADGLPAGEHTVELYRESEGMYGDSVFSGFVDGTVVGAPAASGRLIEVVGDSISAGYGNLGNEVHPPWDNACTFSLNTQSAYQSYASWVGRALNAEVSIIARSGWGMYRDLSGSTSGVLSSVYGNTLGTQPDPKWNFARQADVVIVNLGTNDAGQPDGGQGDPGLPYEAAYVAFLRVVRGHYPGAWIFLTIGPMTSEPLLTPFRAHIANVARATGDAKVVPVEIASQDATSTGCDYHPNVAEDQLMAGVLTKAIKAKLGW